MFSRVTVLVAILVVMVPAVLMTAAVVIAMAAEEPARRDCASSPPQYRMLVKSTFMEKPKHASSIINGACSTSQPLPSP